MMSSDYPWSNIHAKAKAGQFSLIETASSICPVRDVAYWGISPTGNPSLVISYKTVATYKDSLPRFANINVMDSEKEMMLAIELRDKAMLDLFYRMCLDIISIAATVETDQRRKACILRLEKWSLFLRSEKNKLSREQQKGLLAELLFLRDFVLPVMEEHEALQGWVGPDKAAQDFTYGQTSIEVKAKSKSSNPSIKISSENQLSVNNSESLYLFVIELSEEIKEKGITLSQLVNEIFDLFKSPIARADFQDKLFEIGYIDETSCEEINWSKGRTALYEVKGDFPRVTSSQLPLGIDSVTYKIDLNECQKYEVINYQLIDFSGDNYE